MGNEYRAKVFKSGNSVALRLPKVWGFQAGDEVEIVPDGAGGFELRRAEEPVATLDALYGSFSSDFMATGREPTDRPERPWDAAADREPGAA